MLVVVLALRAGFALSGRIEFAEPQNTRILQPIQLISYFAAMAMALLGSFGFVLLVKERTDREVMHLAMTDSLTQVPNRRALMDYAEHILARRNGFPLALLMIDVDHFKKINDSHGHQTGDEVLCRISVLLCKRLRGHDLLGRYGGEEFCVIAPETDTKGALVLAESLRKIIVAEPFMIGNKQVSLSVSIGVACCPPDATRNVKEMMAKADAALYDAKQTGRNKVVCFGIDNA